MEPSPNNLESQVERSTKFAIFIVCSAVAAYPLYFWVYRAGAVSDDPAVWGQFGDYVGGLLNPLIALLAFYWLTRSVLIQRQELQDTKQALKDSATAQLKQERNSASAARISALSTMLSSVNADVEAARSTLRQMESPLPATAHPISEFAGMARRMRNTIGSPDEIAGQSAELDALLAHRQELIDKIKDELNSLEGGGIELTTYPLFHPNAVGSDAGP